VPGDELPRKPVAVPGHLRGDAGRDRCGQEKNLRQTIVWIGDRPGVIDMREGTGEEGAVAVAEPRPLRPADIALPDHYDIEVWADKLTAPISMIFSEAGDMFIADAGITDGNGKVLRHTPQGFVVVAEHFRPPVTGLGYYEGDLYVSQRGSVTVVRPDGSKSDILTGLPSFGDHHNNQVVFGQDGKMYFGQGTVTNSGVVGDDNAWLADHPTLHDYPGMIIQLSGDNFSTPDLLTPMSTAHVLTGAFNPFGVPSSAQEVVKAVRTAGGGILRANPDGSELECIAWGLRNPFRIRFDRHNRLLASNHGSDERGSRPIANAPDELHWIRPGVWYGWPDFAGGLPVTFPRFKPDGKSQPQFLLAQHPMLPQPPLCTFTPHSAIMGFDVNEDPRFAPAGQVFIAEFGSQAPMTTGGKPLPHVGHRVSRVDLPSGQSYAFAINRTGLAATATGGGGLERPIDAVFGPDGSLYVVDFGVMKGMEQLLPGTGVIWRIRVW